MGSATNVDRVRAAAHRRSVEVNQTDLVNALVEKLGIKLVAFIANRNTSTITRWREAKVEASEEALRPLRTSYQLIQMLEHHEADATIRAWFMGINPQLDDLSPAEAIADGQTREAIAAARAFLAGG